MTATGDLTLWTSLASNRGCSPTVLTTSVARTKHSHHAIVKELNQTLAQPHPNQHCLHGFRRVFRQSVREEEEKKKKEKKEGYVQK
jgi:hypothetical protein